MKKNVFVFVLAILFVSVSKISFGHCEVPCGIYHDEIRIAMFYEHLITIEKAMTQIEELGSAESVNYNQLIRWTTTKDEHATKIQQEVTQYFITQRLKLPESTEGEAYEKYVKQLTLLHSMIVYAMKCKQTTDPSFVEKSREALAQFEELYFEGKHRHKIEMDH
jgi:nickel superoxide dismutase